VHLLRADIVDLDDKDRLVLVKQALEFLEIDRFAARFAPHDFLVLKLGYLRANNRVGGLLYMGIVIDSCTLVVGILVVGEVHGEKG
jgi:hypothetical protein